MAVNYISRSPDYKDLDLDFFANPSTGDIYKKEGEEAIKRSIRNLLLINFYDRLFQPYIGSNVRKILFEPMTPMTANLLETAITEVINNHEPRVNLQDVRITGDFNSNGFNVTLNYVILNRNIAVETTLFLERIR